MWKGSTKRPERALSPVSGAWIYAMSSGSWRRGRISSLVRQAVCAIIWNAANLAQAHCEPWFSTKPPKCSTWVRSEEHTSELQSLMRISYDVFCLQKNTNDYVC